MSPSGAPKKWSIALFVILMSSFARAELIGIAQRGGVHDRPAREGPNDKHRIKPKELLRVVLYDLAGPDTETAKEVRVDRDGNIGLPLLKKPIHAAGRNILELEKAIQSAYSEEVHLQDISLRVDLVNEKPTTKPAK